MVNNEKISNQKQPIVPAKSKKALMIINISALVIILGVASYFIFFNDAKKRVGQGGKFGPGAMSDNFTIEKICEGFNSQDKMAVGERPQLKDGERPSGRSDGASDMKGEVNQKRFQESQSLITEICTDGKVSDEEKKQFEEMRNNFKPS